MALGIALQITNILRDVGEDWRDRRRIYLPLEDMARFGVTEVHINPPLASNPNLVEHRYGIRVLGKP